MWLSTMISVGRSRVLRKVRNARAKHLLVVGVADARDVPAVADETRVATSSLNARAVLPSIVMWLLS